MGRKSGIERFTPSFKSDLLRSYLNGEILDDLLIKVQDNGYYCSRSALHRWLVKADDCSIEPLHLEARIACLNAAVALNSNSGEADVLEAAERLESWLYRSV